MKAQLNIRNAIKKLEVQTGKDYDIQDIAKKAVLHRHTVTSLMNGRDDTTLTKILDFFSAEGMPVSVDELFVITDD